MVEAVEDCKFLDDAVTASVGRGAVADDLNLFFPRAPCRVAAGSEATRYQYISRCSGAVRQTDRKEPPWHASERSRRSS